MFTQLKQLFSLEDNAKEDSPEQTLKLACAALLVEVMVIDQLSIVAEEQQIVRELHRLFGLKIEEAEKLFELAKSEVKDATSLYQFTRVINQEFSNQQKFELVRQLWQVAYSDEHLDMHEEAIIRRIAELLHLPHSQFMRAKKAARDALRQ